MPRPRSLFRVLTLGGLALAVLSLPAASDATTLHHAVGARTAKVTYPSRLRAGGMLEDGSLLVSVNGLYRLAMQGDGNLVLYWKGKAIWQSRTDHDAPDHAAMQADGNLVIYRGRRVLWSSGSGGHSMSSGYYFALKNDGNMVIYSPANRPIWESYTDLGVGSQLGDSGRSVLDLQERLTSLGYWLGTPDGTFGD